MTFNSHDHRSALVTHNTGLWEGFFLRLDATGVEQERLSTLLEVKETRGIIQTCLTYQNSGQQQSVNFKSLPTSMQVSDQGHWSTGPEFITPWNWVSELCVVNPQQRRRMIVCHGATGLDRIIYVVEARTGSQLPHPDSPLNCQSRPFGSLIIWQPELGVELIIDPRNREQGDATGCGIRWIDQNGNKLQILRQYNNAGLLTPRSDVWHTN